MLDSPFRRPPPATSARHGGEPPPPGRGAPPGPGGRDRRPGKPRLDLPVPVAIAVAALVSGAVYIALEQPLLAAYLRGCRLGAEPADCSFLAGLVTAAGTYLFAGLAAFPVLWFLGVRRALPTALFGGATLAAGWTLSSGFGGSTLTVALLAVAGYAVFFAIFHVLFTRVPGPFAIHLCAAAAIVVVAGYFGLTVLGDTVDDARYSRRVERAVAQLDFDVYVPARLPAGYEVLGGGLNGLSGGDEPKSYHVGIGNGMERALSLTSFRYEPQSFHPPADCGPFEPGYAPPPHPCALVGETPDHVAVYTGDEPMLPQKTVYYARVGRSVVTLADSNTGSPPSMDLAMTVFGSLERRSAAQLREMNARLRPRD